MIEEILEIGKQLSRIEFESELFTEKARTFIDQFSVDKALSEFNHELGKWMLENTIPEQLNVYNGFGQPPVTVFRHQSFVIDLYFWMHANTSIHSHSFCGAFKVLYGQSLHEEFEIEEVKTFSNDVAMNEMTRKSSEILVPGDCRTITRGRSFSHRVIHLSCPTVTLCIRTVSDKDSPQWHYFDNGLSIQKREIEQSTLKKIFYGDYLFQLDSESTVRFVQEFSDSLTPSELINLFEQLTVDTMGLSDDFQELLYNVMIEDLKSLPWFHYYEAVYENDQSLTQVDFLDERARLESLLSFYNYKQDEIQKLLNQIG